MGNKCGSIEQTAADSKATELDLSSYANGNRSKSVDNVRRSKNKKVQLNSAFNQNENSHDLILEDDHKDNLTRNVNQIF